MAQALFIALYLIVGIIITLAAGASDPARPLSPRGIIIMVTLYPVITIAAFTMNLLNRDGVDG